MAARLEADGEVEMGEVGASVCLRTLRIVSVDSVWLEAYRAVVRCVGRRYRVEIFLVEEFIQAVWCLRHFVWLGSC